MRRLATCTFACLLGLASCAALGRGQSQPRPDELLARRRFAWHTDSSAHFLMHLDTSAVAARADLLSFRLEAAHTRVKQLLDAGTTATPIHVFVVGSRARMKALVGRSTNGIAFYRTNTIALVITPEWRASAVHELAHVLVMREWGVGPTWLNEGLAVYADGEWRGRPLHDAARAVRLVSFERLVRKFRDVDEQVAYPQAGSFVQWLFEKHGRALLHALWREEHAEVMRIAGKDVVALEREWRDAQIDRARARATGRARS